MGDPNQLDPVLPLPVAVEGALARHHGVARAWWPSETSAQRLADQSMDIGTWPPGSDGDPIWVGCPLRVHRRCDEPMFSISNRIAYDGLMVHGKAAGDHPLPGSMWIDFRGKDNRGHWIAAEGRALNEFCDRLRRLYGDDILRGAFFVSPFRDCARQLWRVAKDHGLDTSKAGTVH